MTAIANPPAFILAGGRASRMGGGDKPLRLMRGRPLLAHVIERLSPQCSALAISANGDPARFAAFGLPVLADEVPDYPGPLAGIAAGLRWAREAGATQLITAAGDTPLLPPDLVARLLASGPLSHAASAGRDHPTLALWPVSLLPQIEAALAAHDHAVFRLMARHGARRVIWPAEPYDPFFNINTPDDLAQAQAFRP